MQRFGLLINAEIIGVQIVSNYKYLTRNSTLEMRVREYMGNEASGDLRRADFQGRGPRTTSIPRDNVKCSSSIFKVREFYLCINEHVI
jgi:hypothetical protein